MNIDLDQVKIPKKVDPCPIFNATVEFRFEPSVSDDEFIGVVYREFNQDYPILKDLPGLQVPHSIAKSDQSLRYIPYYKLAAKDSNNSFQVGLDPSLL